LVFDEATAALDNATEREVTRAIEALRGKKTLIVIAHRLTTVRRCDALIFLADGKVRAVGPFDQLLDENAEFRAMAALPEGALLPDRDVGPGAPRRGRHRRRADELAVARHLIAAGGGDDVAVGRRLGRIRDREEEVTLGVRGGHAVVAHDVVGGGG